MMLTAIPRQVGEGTGGSRVAPRSGHCPQSPRCRACAHLAAKSRYHRHSTAGRAGAGLRPLAATEQARPPYYTQGTGGTLHCSRWVIPVWQQGKPNRTQSARAHLAAKSRCPQQKPTLWEETLLLGAGPTGERSGPPPRLAVEGRSSGHGPMLPISDVTYIKSMLASPRGGPWPRAPSRAWALPGDKTGLRLSPHLAPTSLPTEERSELSHSKYRQRRRLATLFSRPSVSPWAEKAS